MIYILLLIGSFCLTYAIKEFAIKKSFVALVNERSSHSVPTPHGGGLAIAITWFLGLLYLFYTQQIEHSLFYVLMLGLAISILSFFDDIYELRARVRLFVHAIVAIVGLYLLGGFNSLDFGFFTISNPIFTNLFAFFLIVWFINLYNFLDGINGYAGAEAVFLSIAGFLLFGDKHFLVLLVSTLGFLYWNWNKAKIFMGDVGSTLLGYNIAIFTLYYAEEESMNFWIWIILFSLFLVDATLTLLRRCINVEKIGEAHRKHAYQRLTQSGWSHHKVTNWAIVINCILLCLVYFINSVFIAFSISIMLLYGIITFIDIKKGFK